MSGRRLYFLQFPTLNFNYYGNFRRRPDGRTFYCARNKEPIGICETPRRLVTANAHCLAVAVSATIATGDAMSGTKAAADTESTGQIARCPLGPIVLHRGMMRLFGQFIQERVQSGDLLLGNGLDAVVQYGRQDNDDGTDERYTLHDAMHFYVFFNDRTELVLSW